DAFYSEDSYQRRGSSRSPLLYLRNAVVWEQAPFRCRGSSDVVLTKARALLHRAMDAQPITPIYAIAINGPRVLTVRAKDPVCTLEPPRELPFAPLSATASLRITPP